MRIFLIIAFCLAFTACAGTRTLDGETTKDWVKIVSSRVDNSGTVRDVCFLLNVSFSPDSAYDRIKNNPANCIEKCCWYSENKNVDFYFNDGFAKDLEEFGVSRRYYPEHIRIKMTYAPFINRLSARASLGDAISKNGVITLQFEDLEKVDRILNKNLDKVQEKVFTEEDSSRLSKGTKQPKEPISYKTVSISGVNRTELLAQAQAEEEKGRAHAQNIAAIYSTVSDGKTIEQNPALEMQISTFESQNISKNISKPAKQAKPLETEVSPEPKKLPEPVKSSKPAKVAPVIVAANKPAEAEPEVLYDVQKPASQDNTVDYVEPKPQELSGITLAQKLAYERKQAVSLLKRFYGEEIDAYLRFLDKAKKQDGQVLLTNDKVWQAKKIGTPIYSINCKVNGKIALLGTDANTVTTNYPIACGNYIVNLDEKTVEAKDELAQKIAKKKY